MNQDELDAAVDRLNSQAPGFGDAIRTLTGLVARFGFYDGRKVLQKVLPEWRPNWERPVEDPTLKD